MLEAPLRTAMRHIQFEPFGEPVDEAVAHDPRSGWMPNAEKRTASRIVLRSGVGLFWMLVIGIVAARAAYFDPDFAEKFGSIAAVTHYLHSILSA